MSMFRVPVKYVLLVQHLSFILNAYHIYYIYLNIFLKSLQNINLKKVLRLGAKVEQGVLLVSWLAKMATVYLGLRLKSRKLERLTLDDVDLNDTVDSLRQKAAAKSNTAPEKIGETKSSVLCT